MALYNRLKVISEEDCIRIHEASLKILKETGVVFHCDEAVDILKKHGAKAENKKVFFPGGLVKQALETCPRSFKWTASNEKRSVVVGGGNECLIQPNLGPIYVHDIDEGRRLGKIDDFINFQKITQASDTIKLAGALPVDPSDVNQDEKFARLMYETLRNTDKPIVGCAGLRYQVRQQLDMLEIAVGGKETLEKNHFIGVATNPLSPLAFSADALETIIEYATRNQSIFIPSAVMTGVTGPVSLFGTTILQNAEILAALTLIQMINPENPVVYCTAAVVSNMKRASFNTGAPEGTLMHVAGLQMGQDFYHLPTRSLCGFTEAKTTDYQAGCETMQSLMMCMLAGTDIVVEFLGCLECIMTTSYEKTIIDEEIAGRMLRILQGMDTSEDLLQEAMQTIQEIGPQGNYLVHPSTMKHFRENWMPFVSDWDSYSDWGKKGCNNALVNANRRYREIIENAPDSLLDEELDRELKSYMKKAIKI